MNLITRTEQTLPVPNVYILKNWISPRIIDWLFTVVLDAVHKSVPWLEIVVSFVPLANTTALINKNSH